jgi:hypothetical protein
MGKYFSGDIEGKFWRGVLDPFFFGGTALQPSVIEYYFGQGDKDSIERGITKCRQVLGDYKETLDNFFAENKRYNDDKLVKAELPKEKIPELIEWYARLQLGNKILQCVTEKGYCSFKGER